MRQHGAGHKQWGVLGSAPQLGLGAKGQGEQITERMSSAGIALLLSPFPAVAEI